MNKFARMVLVSLCVLGTGSLGLAADGGAATTAPAAAAEADLKITLMDGSMVSGKLSVNELTVETPYGALRVPIDQISSVTPGLQSHPTFEKKIADLVSDLGGDVFSAREKAQAALIKMGPAVENELRRYLKTAEAEKQTRLQKIVDDFESERSEAEDEEAPAQQWIREDVVVTKSFAIVGRITTPGFAVSSPYGTLQLKVDDIRSAKRDLSTTEEIRKSAVVNGSVVPSRDYVNTGVRLAKGDQVTITATGNITMTPWGQASVGPEGSNNYGTMQPGNIPCGALIARVGSSGNAMKVGAKHVFTAEKAGVLQLSVATPQGDYSGQEFPGEFNVKIRVVHKGE